jgi:hypothetical protein
LHLVTSKKSQCSVNPEPGRIKQNPSSVFEKVPKPFRKNKTRHYSGATAASRGRLSHSLILHGPYAMVLAHLRGQSLEKHPIAKPVTTLPSAFIILYKIIKQKRPAGRFEIRLY